MTDIIIACIYWIGVVVSFFLAIRFFTCIIMEDRELNEIDIYEIGLMMVMSLMVSMTWPLFAFAFTVIVVVFYLGPILLKIACIGTKKPEIKGAR